MLDLRDIGHDVPDPMDMPYFTALAMREAVGGAHYSGSTLDDGEDIDAREMDRLDVPIVGAESSEATDVESGCGVVEVRLS